MFNKEIRKDIVITFIEFIKLAAISFTSLLGGYEVLTLFSSIMGIEISIISNNIKWIMSIAIIIGAGYLIYITFGEIFKKKAIIKLKSYREQKIIIKIGNYESNMKKIIEYIDGKDREAIFVIGINDKLDLSKANRKGVNKAVIDAFYQGVKLQELQTLLNKLFIERGDSRSDFGQTYIVDHSVNSKIMFTINSKCSTDPLEAIVGPQPTNIIRDVFKELENKSVSIVQFPILSSTNVRCIEDSKILYSITIAEIIEEYFKQLLDNRTLGYDLVLSLKAEDMRKNSITLKNIVKLIEDLKPMYHIK